MAKSWTLAEGASATPEEAKEPLVHIMSWIGITLFGVVLTYVVFHPARCRDSEACREWSGGGDDDFHQFVICGLLTALVVEVVGMFLTWKSAKKLFGVVHGVEYAFIPPILLCIAFLMLVFENFALTELTFVHVAADGVAGEHSRPVFSVILLEWCVNMPILLVVSGAYGLQRSVSEVSRPIIVTNVYIILAWAAYFISNKQLRWGFVALSFGLFALASYDIANWVIKYRASTSHTVQSRNLRCALTIGLNLSSLAYGLVYLAALLDLFSPRREMIFYVTCGFGVKLVFLIAFVGIRSSHFYELLVTLVANKLIPFSRTIRSKADVEAGMTDAVPLIE
mmetsp:Transcript_101337/g.291990  ORF Transcript_101337/g.291990 Transcript_101337/m.291990 type:complete len:338 (-) Transcript_101337:299-1312(-)